jgi:hypothetical protein
MDQPIEDHRSLQVALAPYRKRLSLAAVACLITFSLACGLLQPNAEPGDTSSVEGSNSSTQSPPTAAVQQQPTESSGPERECENPPPEEIPLGEAVAGSVNEANSLNCYWVQVPEGLELVNFEVTGLEDDASLAVGYGFLSTVQFHFGEFWDTYEPDTSDEVITIENPKAGPYFIKVFRGGFDSDTPFELTVATEPSQTAPVTGRALPDNQTCGGPAIQLAFGETATGQLMSRDEGNLDRAYYCVEIPEGTGLVTFTVEVLSNSVDIFVRHSRTAEWYDRDRSDDLREIIIESPVPGAYYLDVEATLFGMAPEFSVTVTAE